MIPLLFTGVDLNDFRAEVISYGSMKRFELNERRSKGERQAQEATRNG